MPITFRNVDQSTNPYALNFLGQASKDITGAIDSVGSVIQDRANRNDDAVSQNILARLSSAQSIGDVEALRKSGELDQLRSKISDPNKLEKLRGAEDARVASLMDSIGKRQVFDQAQLQETHKSKLDEINALFTQGKIQEGNTKANELLTLAPGLNVKNALALASVAAGTAQHARERLGVTEQQHDTKFRQDSETHKSNLETAASTRLNQASTTANALIAAAEHTQANIDKANESKAGSSAGFKSIFDVVSKVTDPDLVPKVSSYLGKVMSTNPQYGNLPTHVVENIVSNFSSTVGSWYNVFRNGDDTSLKAMLDKAVLDNGSVLEKNAATEGSRAATLMRQNDLIEGAANRASPGTAANLNKAITQRIEAEKAKGQPTTQSNKVLTPEAVQTPRTLMNREVETQQAEIAAGLRKEFTKDASEYLKMNDTLNKGSQVSTGKIKISNPNQISEIMKSRTELDALKKSVTK